MGQDIAAERGAEPKRSRGKWVAVLAGLVSLPVLALVAAPTHHWAAELYWARVLERGGEGRRDEALNALISLGSPVAVPGILGTLARFSGWPYSPALPAPAGTFEDNVVPLRRIHARHPDEVSRALLDALRQPDPGRRWAACFSLRFLGQRCAPQALVDQLQELARSEEEAVQVRVVAIDTLGIVGGWHPATYGLLLDLASGVFAPPDQGARRVSNPRGEDPLPLDPGLLIRRAAHSVRARLDQKDLSRVERQ